MVKRKGFEYKRLPQEKRKLYLCGMPSRYWSYDLRFFFSNIYQTRPHIKPYSQTIEDQETWMKVLQSSRGIIESYIVTLGSSPHDDAGMVMASQIVKKGIFKFGLSAKYIDVGRSLQLKKEWSTVPDIVVLHNLHVDHSNMRWSFARDWLELCDDTLCLVVTGGINPVEVMDIKLRKTFDLAFWSTVSVGKIS
jgi:hypothetical protein